MAEARVGDHEYDTWTVFSDSSAFKEPNLIDLSISFNSIMYNFLIVLLLIFV